MEALKNLIIIADSHCGCRLGLYDPEHPLVLDDGGTYEASDLQKKLWKMWKEFWDKWVLEVTEGEPYGVVLNGDSMDGVHHGTVTQISHNLTDQKRIAKIVFEPIVKKASGRFWMVRGTEAHVGQSGQNEEALAEELGAIPNESGQYARHELWIKIGTGLCHIMHHIGTTGSMAYETTALMKEFSDSCAEAGRWGLPAPDCVIRSHRHRMAKIEVPTRGGIGISLTTPGWQLKTPFVYRIPGGRVTTPQMGGILVRSGLKGDAIYTMSKVWNIERPKPEVANV